MTEGNITKEHEGKHGVLALGGSRNDVTIGAVWPVANAFDARVDGESHDRDFLVADGWQFTPDPDPLPTEPGWYVSTADAGDLNPVLYFLNRKGEWRWHWDKKVNELGWNRMVKLHERYPLIRVSFGVAS